MDGDDTQEGRDRQDSGSQDDRDTRGGQQNDGRQNDQRDQNDRQADRQRDDRQDRDRQGDDDADGFDALPEKTKAEIRRLRRADQDNRAKLRDADTAAQFMAKVQALVSGDSGEKPDADKLAETLAERETELKRLRMERAAERVIRKQGGDVDTVIDSRSFAERLARLDPDASGFDDDLAELVKKTVESNPYYRSDRRKGSGTGEHGGRPPAGRPKSLREAYSRRAN